MDEDLCKQCLFTVLFNDEDIVRETLWEEGVAGLDKSPLSWEWEPLPSFGDNAQDQSFSNTVATSTPTSPASVTASRRLSNPPVVTSSSTGRRVASEGHVNSAGNRSVTPETARRPISPQTAFAPAIPQATGRSQNRGGSSKSVHHSPPAKSEAKDPHPHPTTVSDRGRHLILCSWVELIAEIASALAIYKLAHRYELRELTKLALDHLVTQLRPPTAFTLLLATPLWQELHQAIQAYTYEHWHEILLEEDFKLCFDELGEGKWDKGGETLREFIMLLTPSAATAFIGSL